VKEISLFIPMRNYYLRRILPLLLGFIAVVAIALLFRPQPAPSVASGVPSVVSSVPPLVKQESGDREYQAIDEKYQNRFKIAGDEVLKKSTLPNVNVDFNGNDLLTVLKNTRDYYQQYQDINPAVQRIGILGSQGVTMSDIHSTLAFMIATLEEDIAKQQPIRLKDPKFINQNFQVIKWLAYDPQYPNELEVRLTKYAVFTHPGSRTKTGNYTVPLYALKEDAETDRFYLNYTKQQVLSGIYEPGGTEYGRVEPLVYLSRDSFEDALMQGTILIKYADGTSQWFNVDRNNGIAYVPGRAAYSQGRYWYFRSVNDIRGYGHNFESKIAIKPGVTFAGDVLNMGLGRIVVLNYNGKQQMGIIADTGGAFLPNLHQLDYLAGVFANRDEFYGAIANLPEYTQAYLLIHKASP
jgi:hypothetical protein